jgi:MFS family permease
MVKPERSALWRNQDFLLLWSGQAVSVFGTRVSNLALPLLALATTHSAAQAGLITSARMLPYLVLGLPAGALMDRWNRKAAMILCDLARCIALGSVPLAWMFGHLTIAQLYAVALVQGTAFVFFNVAEMACLPNVASREDLPQATAMDSAAGSAASLAGPALAAVGVFVPCYLVVLIAAPDFRRLAANPQVKAFVQGVIAAAAPSPP